MIEGLMIFALGFFLATLFAIMSAQFIWRRAVAATTKRLAAGEPGEEGETEGGPSARIGALQAQVAALEEELAAKTSEIAALSSRNRKIGTHQAEENAALTREVSGLQEALAGARADHEAANAELAEQRARIGSLENALKDAEARRKETGRQARDVAESARKLAALLQEPEEAPAPAQPQARPQTAARPAEPEAPQARQERPAPIKAQPPAWANVVPGAGAAAAGTAHAHHAEKTAEGENTAALSSEEYEEIRESLLSFSDGVKEEFGDREDENEEEEHSAHTPASLERNLEDRIKALQEGSPIA